MLIDDLRDLLPVIREREQRDPESYPALTVADLQQLGLPGAPFPARLGGRDASLAEAVSAVETLAGASASAALVLSMPLGLAGVLTAGGRLAPASWQTFVTAQTEGIAHRYREGAVYAACNSEKGAGGSLAAIQTVATATPDGGFTLSGEKILASSGRFARVYFSTARVAPEDLPSAGVVEFFLVPVAEEGVEILADWDGFGMRSTESQTVRYHDARAETLFGFPNFIELVHPLEYWFCLFSAIPLGCAGAMLTALSTPAPASPALRLRLSEARARYESMRAYLMETAAEWRPGAGAAYRARVLRTKTYVTEQSTRLCAELFALGGGRHYRRSSPFARAFADAFAGTALRPPLPLALDALIEQFGGAADG